MTAGRTTRQQLVRHLRHYIYTGSFTQQPWIAPIIGADINLHHGVHRTTMQQPLLGNVIPLDCIISAQSTKEERDSTNNQQMRSSMRTAFHHQQHRQVRDTDLGKIRPRYERSQGGSINHHHGSIAHPARATEPRTLARIFHTYAFFMRKRMTCGNLHVAVSVASSKLRTHDWIFMTEVSVLSRNSLHFRVFLHEYG